MTQGFAGGVGGFTSSSRVIASSKGGAGSAGHEAAEANQSERKINAIQTIIKDGKVIVAMIIDGRMSSWVEYDPEQLDGLIDLLKAARAQI